LKYSNLTGRQTEAAARQKHTNASSRRVCLKELQLLIPIAMKLHREIRPAGTRYALPGTRKIQIEN